MSCTNTHFTILPWSLIQIKWLDSIDLLIASDEKMSGIGEVYEVFIGKQKFKVQD